VCVCVCVCVWRVCGSTFGQMQGCVCVTVKRSLGKFANLFWPHKILAVTKVNTRRIEDEALGLCCVAWQSAVGSRSGQHWPVLLVRSPQRKSLSRLPIERLQNKRRVVVKCLFLLTPVLHRRRGKQSKGKCESFHGAKCYRDAQVCFYFVRHHYRLQCVCYSLCTESSTSWITQFPVTRVERHLLWLWSRKHKAFYWFIN